MLEEDKVSINYSNEMFRLIQTKYFLMASSMKFSTFFSNSGRKWFQILINSWDGK